jgi:hypothetical protein
MRSALAFLFVECETDKIASEVSKNLWKKVSLYKKGCRRANARERQELGLRTTKGKDPMPLAALVYLCQILVKSPDPEHLDAQFFLLLDWNLFSRAESIVNSHIDLFGLHNDALLVQVGKTKGDQDGTKHVDHPFHKYSVPENPVICPVLAFIHSFNGLRTSPFLSESIPHADRVRTVYQWTKTTDTPEITGFPVDVLYMSKIETLKLEIA